MIFIFIGLGLIGFLPMFVILYRKRRSDRMVKTGVATEAIIKRIHSYHSRMLNPVDIEYMVKEQGKVFIKTIMVAGTPYAVGDRLPMYYDPKDPSRTQFPMKKGFIVMFIFTLIIAAFVIFACFKLYEMV